MQLHSALHRPPDTAAIAWNMRRLAALGLRVQITEMDVGVTDASGTIEERLSAQAEVYRGVLAACLAEPACTALVTWGVSDRYTWRHPDTPLLLDTEFRPKPAYRAMVDLLGEAAPAARDSS
jgi:endo-1,4-beta-xylanase